MKRLIIVVPEGENNLSSIVGSYKILTRAEEHWAAQGQTPRFRIELAGCSPEVGFYGGLFAVRPHTTIQAVDRADLVIVPSLNHLYNEAIELNQPLMAWLSAQYRAGAEVASICTGAFLLGAAGLLDGKACSTHWSATDAFRARFPKVRLQPDRLITDEGGICTNGGAYSFLNLILYLIEKHYDRATAIFCSKVFQIEMDRDSQAAFTMFTGQKQHGDDVVRQAQAYIEEHWNERLSVDEISARFAVGRRNFDRRFIKATGNTPLEYAQRVRIESAKKAFESTRKNVSEVMYEVGYSDQKAFREVFRKVTGMSPLEYKERYNRS